MPRILVIDNDLSANVALAALLSAQGYDVTGVITAARGLRLFDAARFDAVITEIIMPDTDGIEVIMTLRAASRKVPIIAMSGGGRHLSVDYCLKLALGLGAVGSFQKPVDPDALLNALGDLLRP